MTSTEVPHCPDPLLHCHALSVIHDDGFRECTAETPCSLAHELHDWVSACAQAQPDCACQGLRAA